MNQDPKPNDIVVALDIGTTKICAVAGKRNEHGKIEVLSFAKVKSDGVNRGVVQNIEKTVRNITEAISLAEQRAGISFHNVHVGIAGQHIKTRQDHGKLPRTDGQADITQSEIDHLIQDVHKIALSPGEKILHIIPQDFIIDGEQGITDPVGMFGNIIEANFHIVTGQITSINNIYRCVERTGLQVADLTLEPIASSYSVLSDEEKDAGVALLDIGGGTTDLTIFKKGIIRHTAVLPFGGNRITNDIEMGCQVSESDAEEIKCRYGSALVDEIIEPRIIVVSELNGRRSREIRERNIALIIEARMRDIIDWVMKQVIESGFEKKLIGGIVVTGGGALLMHIDKLMEYYSGLPCRVGAPREQFAQGYHEDLNNPIYATSVGLLIKGIITQENLAKAEKLISKNLDDSEPEGDTILKKIFDRTKKWFEAEHDISI